MCDRLRDRREQRSWFQIHLIEEDQDGAATRKLQWTIRQEGHACHLAEAIDGSGCIEVRILAADPVEELIRLLHQAALAAYCVPVTPPWPVGAPVQF
jgi:hypothetical protein